MANFIEALGESVNRAGCVILGGLAGQEELLRYVLEPLQTGNPGYNGLGALYAQNCDRPPPGRVDPPFTGGQCQGTYYRVQGTYNVPNAQYPPITGTFNRLAYGAIRGVRGGAEGNDLYIELLSSSADGSGGLVVDRFAGFGGAAANGYQTPQATITSVTPQGGAPDNCGDPEPIPPVLPPGGNTYNDNVTYINNEGDTITIPINIVLGYAQVNFNGQLTIPVSASFSANPELNFEGDYNFNTGNVNINIGNPALPRPGKDGTPKDYTAPDTPNTPDDMPPSIPLPPYEPEAEQYDVIRAAIVTVTAIGGLETLIFQDENPNIYVPSLGYVSFLIQIGDIQAWTNDLPVKNRQAFIVCPWEAGAIDVKGTARAGNSIVVSPVVVAATAQPTYPS